MHMTAHELWDEQCWATRHIKEKWGLKSALEYLIGQKLLAFAYWAQTQPNYAAELPLFIQEIPAIFTEAELIDYMPSLSPKDRKEVRRLLNLLISSSNKTAGTSPRCRLGRMW